MYFKDAYGRLAAFLTGWTSFVAGFSGAIAVSAVVLASYLGRFIPAAANDIPMLAMPIPSPIGHFPLMTFIVSRQSLVAIAAIALMSWVHLRGVGPGRAHRRDLGHHRDARHRQSSRRRSWRA